MSTQPEIGSRWRDNDTRMSHRVVTVVGVSLSHVTVQNGPARSSYSSGRKTKIQIERFLKAFRPEGGAA